MASLSLSISGTTVYWTISGLENAFNTTYYKSAGVASSSFSDGASSVSTVSSKSASSSGTSTSVSGSFSVSSYSAGTYTFYGFARAANGKYYSAGSDSVTVVKYPSYVISDYDDSSVTLTVTTEGYAYFTIYYRLSSVETATSVRITRSGVSSFTYTISGLEPQTSYTVNVGYRDSSSGSDLGQCGAKTFTTLETQTNAYIWTGSWTHVTPYIYVDSTTGWVKYKANIYYNGWKS